MAEFQEVMKQWRRMCDKHLCPDKECSAVTNESICPIIIYHAGYPCDSGFVDCSPESMAQVEQIVMDWASEHPEPVYELDLEPDRHGRWVTEWTGETMIVYGVKSELGIVRCSVCGGDQGKENYKYCPHCGAKMDGGELDETD